MAGKLRVRPRRRRVVRKVKKVRRSDKRVPEWASASYSTLTQLLKPAQSMPGGTGAYAFRSFSLSAAGLRIQNIASAYQEFRIKRITWQCRGFFDTFVAPGTATAPTVPHLYYRYDKLANYTSDTDLTTLKSSGARPIRLDDKLIKRTFKPYVFYPVLEASSTTTSPIMTAGAYKVSPWLATNANAYVNGATSWAPSVVAHSGVIIAIDMDVVAFSSVAGISFTVEYEFRKPLDDVDTSNVSSMEVISIKDLLPLKPEPPAEKSV